MRVYIVGEDTNAVVEFPTSRRSPETEKRPEPGSNYPETVPLPLENELWMQREVSPAVWTEFSIDDGRSDLTGNTANLSGVATVLPQDHRTRTEGAMVNERLKARRVLKIEVAIHSCEL